MSLVDGVIKKTDELVAQLAAMHGKIPDRFGEFGGQYVPRLSMDCLTELERRFQQDQG